MLERPPSTFLRKKKIPGFMDPEGTGSPSGATYGGELDPSFAVRLDTTIAPWKAMGSNVATFTRATGATVEDWEQNIWQALSGEVRFQGARRVHNWISGSESSATWGASTSGTGIATTITSGQTAPDGTATAFRVTAQLGGGTASGDSSVVKFTPTVPGAGQFITPLISIWIKNNGGGTQVLLRQSGATASYVVTIDNTWRKYSVLSTATTGADSNIFTIGCRGTINNTDIDCLIWHPMCEDITGQSNTNPSEYVSVGVLSAPFHGANVDGVKYFATQNGNTVVSNVVAEATGASIAASIIKGFLAEGARTNLWLMSEDLSDAFYTKTDTTITTNSIVAPDGNTTADLATEGVAGTASISASRTGTADVNYTVSRFLKFGNCQWLRLQVGNGVNNTQVWFDVQNGVVGGNLPNGTSTFVSGSIKAYPNGWYRCTTTISVLSAATAISFNISSASANNSTTRVNNATYYNWGNQFEDNTSFPSSYIPTTTVAVTRNGDALSYVAAGNFSSANGSIYYEGSVPVLTTNYAPGVVASFGGAITESVDFAVSADASNNTGRLTVRSGGSAQADITTTGTITAGTTYKFSGRWATNNFALARTVGFGTAFGTDVVGITPTQANIIEVGGRLTNSGFVNLKNVKVWPEVVSDAVLQGWDV